VSLLVIHEHRKVVDVLILHIVSFIFMLMWLSLSQFRNLLLLLLILYLSLCLVLGAWRKKLYLNYCTCIPNVLRMWSLLHSLLILILHLVICLLLLHFLLLRWILLLYEGRTLQSECCIHVGYRHLQDTYPTRIRHSKVVSNFIHS